MNKSEKPVLNKIDLENGKTAIDITNLDARIKFQCAEIATEFHEMSFEERIAFTSDDPVFPTDEKVLLLETCICVLEQTEDYEICATLQKLKESLLGIC